MRFIVLGVFLLCVVPIVVATTNPVCPEGQYYNDAFEKCADRCPEFMKWDGKECQERCDVDSGYIWNNTLKKCIDLFEEDKKEVVKPKEFFNPVKHYADKFFHWWGKKMRSIFYGK